MSETAWFEPLLCPRCNADLLGRSRDLVAFCPACENAFLFGGPDLIPLRSALVAGGGSSTLTLPFWRRGPLATPAFLSARPLALARAASRSLATWTVEPGYARPEPRGARLGPETLAQIARLAQIPAAKGSSGLELLAVPCAWRGTRGRIEGFAFELVADDVLELASL